jgi:hypothetical protein
LQNLFLQQASFQKPLQGLPSPLNRPSQPCSPHIAAVAKVCQRQPSNPERVTKGSAMGTYFPEPTLAELLSDRVTRAVMQADGVNPWELIGEVTAISFLNFSQY